MRDVIQHVLEKKSGQFSKPSKSKKSIENQVTL